MNITEKIVLKENKTLKLNNVLVRELGQNDLKDIEKITYLMSSYIKAKGNSVQGPLINYAATKGDENGQLRVVYRIMMQLKQPIRNVDTPYEFISQVKVTNCLYAKFTEKEENLKFAYSKMGVYAFENDIKLKGDSYTVFVNKNDNGIVADVFMELLKGGNELESL